MSTSSPSLQAIVPDLINEIERADMLSVNAEALKTSMDDTEVTLFANKYVPGGEAGEHGPVSWLLEPWEADVHYTQYSVRPARRLTVSAPYEGVSFGIVVVDIDAHHTTPTQADWEKAIRYASLLDYVPNIVTRTRGGAHFIYLIDPMGDPWEFQLRRMVLVNKVRPIENATIYTVDETKDWTRLFRAPRCIRDDGTDLREAKVYGIHADRLNLRRFDIPKRNKRRTVTLSPRAGDLSSAARYAAKVPGAVSGQGGHNATFRLACALVQKFGLDEDQTFDVLEQWNDTCDPPWSERELRHKATEAVRVSEEIPHDE